MKDNWQTYKSLELLPDLHAEPQPSHSIIVRQVDRLWRSLAKGLIEHLVYEQRVERLENCWKLTEASSRGAHPKPTAWGKLWTVLNQPLFEWNLQTSSEPEIRQVSDPSGQIWWYAYDPMTGQKVYLESEVEVQIWLEERLYQ